MYFTEQSLKTKYILFYDKGTIVTISWNQGSLVTERGHMEHKGHCCGLTLSQISGSHENHHEGLMS